jgi:hypothetical protein
MRALDIFNELFTQAKAKDILILKKEVDEKLLEIHLRDPILKKIVVKLNKNYTCRDICLKISNYLGLNVYKDFRLSIYNNQNDCLYRQLDEDEILYRVLYYDEYLKQLSSNDKLLGQMSS